MIIDVTPHERLMILDALRHPAYTDKVQNPKTKYFIRKIYQALVEKVKNAQEEPQKQSPKYGFIRRFLIKIIMPKE